MSDVYEFKTEGDRAAYDAEYDKEMSEKVKKKLENMGHPGFLNQVNKFGKRFCKMMLKKYYVGRSPKNMRYTQEQVDGALADILIGALNQKQASDIWLNKGYTCSNHIPFTGPLPMLGNYIDSYIAGYVCQRAAVGLGMTDKQICELVVRVYNAFKVTDEAKSHVSVTVAKRIRLWYGLSHKKPQVQRHKRLKAGRNNRCVKMWKKLAREAKALGYMTSDNKWTDIGKDMTICLDETCNKLVVRQRTKETSRKHVTPVKGKVSKPQHLSVLALHDLNFKAIAPGLITSHDDRC